MLHIFFIEFAKIEPIVVGIWCGTSKPILSEYMKPFVDEMKYLLPNGLDMNGFNVKIEFGMCNCDSPARSLIKGNNFNAYLNNLNNCECFS